MPKLLPEIEKRFVWVRLSTGEIEVLVTSRLDEEKYTTQMLKELYHLRWGVEGFFGVLKERLKMDNFTGKTVVSVRQDFFATMFLTGLESVLTQLAVYYCLRNPVKINTGRLSISLSLISLKIL